MTKAGINTIQIGRIGNLGYTVNSAISYFPHDAGVSAWQPVAPLNQTNGDLTLLMLNPNSITYTEPVNDPMVRTGNSPDMDLIGGAPYIPSRAACMYYAQVHLETIMC